MSTGLGACDRDLEVELLPGLPPRVGARDDGALADPLDSRAVSEAVRLGRVLELRLDLAGPTGVVWRDGSEVGERLAVGLPDALASAHGSERPRRFGPEAALHGCRRQAGAQQGGRLATGRLVAGHEQHGTVPRTAQRGV